MTTTIEVPGALVGTTPGRLRLRRRPTVPAPGDEAVTIDYLASDDAAVIASFEPTEWKVRRTIDDGVVRSTLTWTVPPEEPATAEFASWSNETLLRFAGRILHRGPHLQDSGGVAVAQSCTAADGFAWIESILTPHPFPGDVEAIKWDAGTVLSMAQAMADRWTPAIGGGELSSGVPLLLDAYANRRASEVVSLIAGISGVELWVDELDDDALGRRLSWGTLHGRNIPSTELTLTCRPGEVGNVETFTWSRQGGQAASMPVVVGDDGVTGAHHTTGMYRGIPVQTRISAEPGTGNDPDLLDYQSVRATIGDAETIKVTIADRSIAQIVDVGDRVVVDLSAPGRTITGVIRVVAWELDATGPLLLDLGTLPARDAVDYQRIYLDRVRELEEQRKGAVSTVDLADWDLETTDTAGDDTAKLAKVPKEWQNPRWKSVTRGGKTKLMLTPGPAEAESPEQWLIGPISLTSGGGDYGEITTGLIPAGMDWDPERPWRGLVSVSVSTTALDELRDTGWTAIAFRSPVQSPTVGYSGVDLSLAAANSWVVTVPLDGLAGWPALHVDSGAIAYADPDATVLAFARIRQI